MVSKASNKVVNKVKELEEEKRKREREYGVDAVCWRIKKEELERVRRYGCRFKRGVNGGLIGKRTHRQQTEQRESMRRCYL